MEDPDRGWSGLCRQVYNGFIPVTHDEGHGVCDGGDGEDCQDDGCEGFCVGQEGGHTFIKYYLTAIPVKSLASAESNFFTVRKNECVFSRYRGTLSKRVIGRTAEKLLEIPECHICPAACDEEAVSCEDDTLEGISAKGYLSFGGK